MAQEQQFTMVKKQDGVEIKAIKPPKEDYSKYSLSEKEAAKVIDACKTSRDRAIVLLMLHCALRRMEVAGLRIEHLDWERKLIHLKTYKGQWNHPKNDEELTVPISQRTFDALLDVRGSRKDGWLFEGKLKRKAICGAEINHIIERLGQEAGLTNPIPSKAVKRVWRPYTLHSKLNPHLLRHTCIRLYLKHGGDIRMAQKLARHSDISLTLQTYGTPSLSDRVGEYNKVVSW